MTRLPMLKGWECTESEISEAYLRGWREGIETLLEDYPDAEAPHKDAMGEGCGTFLGEWWWGRLASRDPEAAKLEEMREALERARSIINPYFNDTHKAIYQQIAAALGAANTPEQRS